MWLKFEDMYINLDNITGLHRMNNRIYFKFIGDNDNITNIDFKNSKEMELFIEYLDSIIKAKEIKI